MFKSQTSLSTDSGLCTERGLRRTHIELVKPPGKRIGLKLAGTVLLLISCSKTEPLISTIRYYKRIVGPVGSGIACAETTITDACWSRVIVYKGYRGTGTWKPTWVGLVSRILTLLPAQPKVEGSVSFIAKSRGIAYYGRMVTNCNQLLRALSRHTLSLSRLTSGVCHYVERSGFPQLLVSSLGAFVQKPIKIAFLLLLFHL